MFRARPKAGRGGLGGAPNPQEPARLTLDRAACVRGRLVHASCQKCAQVCPSGAVGFADGAPVIDAQACSDCGACAGACPEGAIRLTPPVNAVQVCAQHPMRGQGCVHAMGLHDLAGLYQQGARRLVAATGDCDTCEMAPLVTLQAQMATFNALLRSRDLPEMVLAPAGKAELAAWRARTEDRPDPARRGFLRRFVPPPEPVDRIDALLEILALPGAEPLYPHAPLIDARACTGCDDCANICPHDALTLVNAGDGDFAYTCAPERCSGCNLCSDICEADAIKVTPMIPAPDDIPLHGFRCRACGVISRTTAPRPPLGGLCRICARTNHHKNLFVVLP